MKSLFAGYAAGRRAVVAPLSNPRWALAGLSLSMLLPSLGTSIANIALPNFAPAFDASFQQVQWVVLAYLLAITALIVSAGRIGDMMGRRRLLLAGIALFTAASALCGVASTLWLLIVGRAVQGAGAAVMMALTIAAVGDTVPKDKIGSAMGLLGTMSAVGSALGPSLGGVLIVGFGWRAIFFVNLPLGLVALWLVYRALPCDRAKPARRAGRFDGLGTSLLALTLAAYALAVTTGRGHFAALNAGLLLAAFAGAGLFALVERRATAPLIRLALFRNRLLIASLAMNALVATVIMTTFVVGPFYLSRVFGLNEALVGVALAIGPVISIVSGVPSGRMVDRWGASSVAVVGLIAMASGAFVLAALPAAFGIGGYVAGIAILTPGYQLFQAANNTAVMADVGPDERGAISGLLSLSRNLGLISGASVMGAIFALASGAPDVAAASASSIAAGMRTTFAVAGILIVMALALAAVSRGGGTRSAPTRD